MKRSAITLLTIALAAAVGYFVVYAEPARCQKWCSPVVCYSTSACNSGCVCMNPGPQGQCVSFD